jgi:feruloyl esterase
MSMRLLSTLLLATVLSAVHPAVAGSCDALVELELPDLTVEAAMPIEPDPEYVVMQRPGGARDVTVTVPFCRVRGTIDGSIGFELWLPDNWNGKFYSAGVGGYAGRIGVWDMAPALERGYAASSTDTGHRASSENFIEDSAGFMQDEEALENYAYRAVHRTAEISKAIIKEYYGRPHEYAYFDGCSGGGYAGLANAQRYPADYDGIISGAPGTLVTHHAARAMWAAALNREGQPGHIPASKDGLIPSAVTEACDGNDGVKDGLIENPMACEFDFAALACPAGQDTADCLTPAQVETAKRLYGPMLDANGDLIYPATPLGAPLPADALAARGNFYAQFWRHAVFSPDWDPASFSVDDVAVADRKLARYLDAGNPELSAFRKRGGKLLMYHGWHDAGVSPLNSINYYESVVGADGAGVDTSDYFRLFLAPGMGHCRGGIGPDQFDALAALENWVENGEPPERIVASQFGEDGNLVRTRPLCPYPKVASWNGEGSAERAENFSCR